MPLTANFSWPTPVSTDPNDVPTDMALLGGSIDATMKTVSDAGAANTAGLAALNGIKGLARRLYRSTTVSISHSTYTTVTGWMQRGDDPGNVAGGIAYSNGEFTVGADGLYRIGMGAVWATNATGDRQLALHINGTINDATYTPLIGGHFWSPDLDLSLGDVIRIDVRQTSGAALNFGGSSNYCWYACARVA